MLFPLTIKTYPNQKLWIDGSIHAKLKALTTAFNHGKVTGIMVEFKQSSHTTKQSSHQTGKTSDPETKWSRKSMA
jgi:hypothetical protein